MMAAGVMFAFGHISIVVRRFHDLNRSGHHFWLLFIPVVDLFIYLLLLLQPGSEGQNRFDGPISDSSTPQPEDSIEEEVESGYLENNSDQTVETPKSSTSVFYDYAMTFMAWWLVIWVVMYGHREEEAANTAYQRTESGKREIAAYQAKKNIPILARYKLSSDSLKAAEKRLYFIQTLQSYAGENNYAEMVNITVASADTTREHLAKIAEFYMDRFTGCEWLNIRYFPDSLAPHTQSEWMSYHMYFAEYEYQKDNSYKMNGLRYHPELTEWEKREDSLYVFRHEKQN